jgi:sugar fermentation stimulation protein A
MKKALLYFKNLIPCNILERINRFVVKVIINDKEEFAYLTNTGRLRDIIYKGAEGFCLSKEGKLKFTLIATKVNEEEYTLIDTKYQMVCFEEAVKNNYLNWLTNVKLIKRNIKVNNSLIDYLYKNKEEIFIEIKSAVLFDGYFSMYPDCPSIRGRRHVDEILRLKKEGKRAIIVFIAAHPYAKAFKPFYEGDKILAEKIKEAYYNGVEMHAIRMHLEKSGYVYLTDDDLPIKL